MPYKYTKNDEKVIVRYKNGENAKTFQEVMRYCFNLFLINEMKERTKLKQERSEKNV